MINFEILWFLMSLVNKWSLGILLFSTILNIASCWTLELKKIKWILFLKTYFEIGCHTKFSIGSYQYIWNALFVSIDMLNSLTQVIMSFCKGHLFLGIFHVFYI